MSNLTPTPADTYPDFLRRLWARKTVRFAGALAAVFLGVAAVAEVRQAAYRHRDRTPPWQQGELAHADRPPAWGGPWMGTDGLGRDVASRLAQGTRIAVRVGLLTSLIAIPLGVLLGALGGYFGGRVDDAVVWLYTTVASIPGLLLTMAIALVAGKGMTGVCLGIGLTTWVGLCRLVRVETMKQRHLSRVAAARALGAGHGRILIRHIFPQLAPLTALSFTLRFPAAVGTEVFLSFIGLGVQGEPSWGVMIQSARLRLWEGAWWELTFVTLAIFGLVLSLHVIGDALRDALDPRLRRETGV